MLQHTQQTSRLSDLFRVLRLCPQANDNYMPQEIKKYEDKSLDGRYKILPKQYPEVRAKYQELKSSRKVAEIYGVTKKIILFIVKPEIKARDRQRRIRDKVWLQNYDRIEHTKAIAKYRDKKKELGHVINKGRKINKPKKKST